MDLDIFSNSMDLNFFILFMWNQCIELWVYFSSKIGFNLWYCRRCNNIGLLGSSAKSLFSGSITDDAIVKIKEGNNCVVEGTDW